jgi:hypothetical protein
MRAIAAALLVSVALLGQAHADGVSARKRISLDELAATSEVVFSAVILEAQPRWESRMAYGEEQRYVAEYRFQIRVDGWLKGGPPDPAEAQGCLGNATTACWISLGGDPPPGKWLVVEEQYLSAFSRGSAKPHDRILVFASAHGTRQWLAERAGQKTATLHPREVESATRLRAVVAALAKSRPAKRVRKSDRPVSAPTAAGRPARAP